MSQKFTVARYKKLLWINIDQMLTDVQKTRIGLSINQDPSLWLVRLCSEITDLEKQIPGIRPEPLTEKRIRDGIAKLEKSILHHIQERDGWVPMDECYKKVVAEVVLDLLRGAACAGHWPDEIRPDGTGGRGGHCVWPSAPNRKD